MIYFIQSEDGGPIKIGWVKGSSVNGTIYAVEKRLVGLQTGNPSRLIILATIDGTLYNEQCLHEAFKHLHIRGEWFKPAPELLDYISSLPRVDGPRLPDDDRFNFRMPATASTMASLSQ